MRPWAIPVGVTALTGLFLALSRQKPVEAAGDKSPPAGGAPHDVIVDPGNPPPAGGGTPGGGTPGGGAAPVERAKLKAEALAVLALDHPDLTQVKALVTAVSLARGLGRYVNQLKSRLNETPDQTDARVKLVAHANAILSTYDPQERPSPQLIADMHAISSQLSEKGVEALAARLNSILADAEGGSRQPDEPATRGPASRRNATLLANTQLYNMPSGFPLKRAGTEFELSLPKGTPVTVLDMDQSGVWLLIKTMDDLTKGWTFAESVSS